MISSDNDRFFGAISVSNQPKYASCGFVTLEKDLRNHVTPEGFTKHLRRMASQYGIFRLAESYSNASLAPLLELIDPSQVDLVKIYAIESNYKFFGIELIFIEGVIEIRSCWTFEGSHEEELRGEFWNALQASALFPKSVLQDGNSLIDLTYNNLKIAKTSKTTKDS